MIRELLSRIAPTAVKERYRDYRLRREVSAKMTVPTAAVFSEIYRNGVWASSIDPEWSPFCSGPGTVGRNAQLYVDYVVAFLQRFEIRSITDLGCGDFRIMSQVLARRPDVTFAGVDVVPELIEFNQRRFGTEMIRFLCLDPSGDDCPPPADLVTIRQVLQHLNNRQIGRILSHLGGFRYALITEHLPIGQGIRHNVDKPHDSSIRVDRNSGVFIDKPPFALAADTVLEYREDYNGIPAVLRTSLVATSAR